MATLQKIRSKGPLLVIVIGLALFAFIAGDAWKIFQPHQNQRDAGVVDGEKISAQEFQDMVEEYTRVQELLTNNHISDDALTQIRDGVWQSYVTYKLIETEADKLGLTVTDDEIKQMLQDGTSPLLNSTPFVNPQTGMFDKGIMLFCCSFRQWLKPVGAMGYAQFHGPTFHAFGHLVGCL